MDAEMDAGLFKEDGAWKLEALLSIECLMEDCGPALWQGDQEKRSRFIVLLVIACEYLRDTEKGEEAASFMLYIYESIQPLPIEERSDFLEHLAWLLNLPVFTPISGLFIDEVRMPDTDKICTTWDEADAECKRRHPPT